MAKLTDIQAAADTFLADIKAVYGDAVSSVILYGPAARGGDPADTAGIGFMVIMADNSPSELARCAGYLKKWKKLNIALPLFLADDYIGRSLDTFPLEFMAMRESYRVIDGADVLDGLEFDSADVRSQCERELKGKLIHLRAEYLSSHGNKKELVDLVKRSLAAFRPIFTGALYLKNADTPEKTGDLLDALADAYGLDGALFRKLEAVARGDISVGTTEADQLFDRYVEELMTFSRAIDAIVISSGESPVTPLD